MELYIVSIICIVAGLILKFRERERQLKFTKVRDVKSPVRNGKDAGLDFFVPNDQEDIILGLGEKCSIPSGIKMQFPNHLAGIFHNKSSIALKGLIVGAEVIDASYRGEPRINLWNISNYHIMIKPGDKIVQMLVMPVETTQPIEISNDEYGKDVTYRGSGGFGSTGSK